MPDIRISLESARLMRQLLNEIADIDRRALCSDRYFRQHFLNVARAAAASAALTELQAAMDEAERIGGK